MAILKKSFTVCTLGLVAALSAACSSSSDGAAGTTGGTTTSAGGASAGIAEARSEKAFDAAPAAPAADYAAVVTGANDLGFALEKQLGENQNFIFSPISIATALSMTYAGARGNTETEMAKVLGDTLGQDKWHAAYNQLVVDLAARNIAQHKTDKGDMSLTLRLADAAFAQKGFDFVPAYLDTLAVHYDAGVKLLDFGADPEGARTLINGWVEDKTEQKIKDLLGQGTITDATRLVLVNALYFYGSWSTPFAKESTKAAAFHAPAGDVQADTMFAQLEAPYLEGDGFKATELPYDGGKVAMTIVLPDDGKLADVEAGLSNTWLSNLSVDLVGHGATVNLSLPKFKFTWGTKELKDSLQTLGMKDLFTLPPADLSGMQADKSLYVSHVVHKAFVGVDEYGTEAAAATAVVVDVGSAPNDPKVLTLDRPFLFFIRDTATGVVLFGGKVVDPTK